MITILGTLDAIRVDKYRNDSPSISISVADGIINDASLDELLRLDYGDGVKICMTKAER